MTMSLALSRGTIGIMPATRRSLAVWNSWYSPIGCVSPTFAPRSGTFISFGYGVDLVDSILENRSRFWPIGQ